MVKTNKNTIRCSLLKCEFCGFEQQTCENSSVTCANENCKKVIDIAKNRIQFVTGGEGGLNIYSQHGN
jgi:hypothetical protein